MKTFFKLVNKMGVLMEKLVHHYFLLKYNLYDADSIFTHLTSQEKRKLFELAQRLPPNSFAVEIGSYLGASACFIAAGLKSNSKLICIDTWKNDAMSEGYRDTKEEFINNTKRFSDKIIMIQGFSKDVVDQVKKITTAIDFLFIDGNHSYEGVKTDWDLYSPLLKSGSCVVFHDYGWAEGVIRVVEEDVKPMLESFDSLPNMFWGYIK
jgi:predicted O-methyltransferase YrrM